MERSEILRRNDDDREKRALETNEKKQGSVQLKKNKKKQPLMAVHRWSRCRESYRARCATTSIEEQEAACRLRRERCAAMTPELQVQRQRNQQQVSSHSSHHPDVIQRMRVHAFCNVCKE